MKILRILRDVEENLRSYLGLKYRLVGVKLIRDEEIEGYPRLSSPAAFCHVVRLASTSGNSYVYGLDYERCPTAQVVLGFKEISYLKIDYSVKPPVTKKVLISPLNEMNVTPDIVLSILNPKQMMDLTVILKVNGEPFKAEFSGEHACAEFFAKPYLKGEPNISLLCSGAREVYSDFRENEIILGAPLKTFIQASKVIESINRIGGSLCGCRLSDLPAAIIEEFESIGFSKGTDYFFGKVDGYNVRVYLNKDMHGRLKFITVYSPIRLSSDEEAEKALRMLKPLMSRPYSVKRRGYWLDISIQESEDALGVNVLDGGSIEAMIKRFVEKVSGYLSAVKVDVG